ncbi:HU family DNA-binding protein [Candidatus Aerophobetes bacterium]|nr:HU family DNA-binding protein [Candidatus Aerophobetes bacterium]
MNKAQLIEKVAGKVDITKKEVDNVVDAFIKTVSNSLSKGQKVTLVGFGTFQVMERKARRGVNPQTGKEIQIPAKKAPKFVSGKSLKDAVK